MPRRNDIAGSKYLVIGSGMIGLGFVMFVSTVALACSIIPPIVDVTSDFEILVVDNGKPVPGIPIEVFKVGVKSEHALLSLKSDANGKVAIRGLNVGEYSIDSNFAMWVPGFIARVGNPQARELKRLVEFHWPVHHIVQSKRLRGKLWNANPQRPFEDLDLQLHLLDGRPASVAQFTGPSGKFDFRDVSPGLYVLWMHAKQANVPKGDADEGSIAVEVIPDSHAGPETLELSIGSSSCGIYYAQCAPSTPIRIATREFNVRDTLGAAVDSANYSITNNSGELVMTGKTDRSGNAQLPKELKGIYKVSIYRSGFSPLEQALDLDAPESESPPFHVTLNVGGTCSTASLENHATQK